jgi:hypothetical protein
MTVAASAIAGEMKFTGIARILFFLLPLIFDSGCATKALWNELDNDNKPANNAHVQLFDARRQKDFLVIYKEYSELNGSTRTRAYYLSQSQNRVEQGKRPHFVSTNLAQKMPQVAVFETSPASDTNFSQPFFCVYSTNTQSLTIYSNEWKMGSYDLPIYNDRISRTAQIALTPVAVVADLTIVGGCLGCLWFYVGAPGLGR